MKKYHGLMIILFLLITGNIWGQSTIYMCYTYPTTGVSVRLEIRMNHQPAFSISRNTKKVCKMYSEGRVTLSFDERATQIFDWGDEIQLNLSKNSVHYIKIKPKGNYAVFEELTEDEGRQEFAKKRYESTRDYEEDPDNLFVKTKEQKH